MLLLIKDSISSLSPSINRGWLSVGSRRACGIDCVRMEAGRNCGKLSSRCAHLSTQG